MSGCIGKAGVSLKKDRRVTRVRPQPGGMTEYETIYRFKEERGVPIVIIGAFSKGWKVCCQYRDWQETLHETSTVRAALNWIEAQPDLFKEVAA